MFDGNGINIAWPPDANGRDLANSSQAARAQSLRLRSSTHDSVPNAPLQTKGAQRLASSESARIFWAQSPDSSLGCASSGLRGPLSGSAIETGRHLDRGQLIHLFKVRSLETNFEELGIPSFDVANPKPRAFALLN